MTRPMYYWYGQQNKNQRTTMKNYLTPEIQNAIDEIYEFQLAPIRVLAAILMAAPATTAIAYSIINHF
jgi:hypothetical protein